MASSAPVPISMSFSVAGDYDPQTKMAKEIVQGSSNFRGMECIDIIPFNLSSGTEVTSDDTRSGRNIGLLQRGLPADTYGESANKGTFSGLVTGSNSHLYGLVYVNSGVNAVLAYGKALDQSVTIESEDSIAYKKKNGVLHHPDFSTVSSPDKITFSLDTYLNSYRTTALYNTWRKNIVGYLNGIVQSNVTNKNVSPNIKYRFNYMDDNPFPADLIAAYDKFVAYGAVTPVSKEVMDARLTELYRAVYPYSVAKSASADYHVGTYYYVYELAKVILSKINNTNFVYVSGSGTWASVKLQKDGPSCFGLPYGAYALQYKEGYSNGRVFMEMLNNKDTNEGTRIGLYTTDERYFTYPPSLYYVSNSQLKTSDDEDIVDIYCTTTGTWDDIVQQYDGTKVTSTTKSAAIKDPLNYGVARFDVRLKKCSSTDLYDSRSQVVKVNHDKFPVTGILVAGQKNVDFGFSPISSSEQYIIYDSDVSNNGAKTFLTSHFEPGSVPLLVLESEQGESVNFALELKNNTSSTFYGINDCAITSGMHFYLVGRLDLSEGVVEGGGTLPSVFVKDHLTTVDINVSSLKNAHIVLPDIREVQLSVGVDAVLNWDVTDPVTIEIQ